MIFVFCDIPAGRSVDVRTISALILQRFANASITAENSFEAERERKRRIIEEFARRGNPITHVDEILASVDNKERSLGPGVDVAIPLGEGASILGEIWAQSVRFETDASRSHPVVEDLVHFLASLDVGPVQVVEE